MTTALTAYLANASSAVITGAKQLYVASGTPTTTTASTTLGTATGYGQVRNAANSVWAAGGSIGAADGNGWGLDASTLDGQQFSGNWSATIRLVAVQSGVPAGTLTGDIYVRVSKYSGGSYSTIVTMALTGQTINSTGANFALPSTAGTTTTFATGDKLYIDVWVNVTVNGNANANQGIRISNLSTDTTTFTGNANASIVSPGYVSGAVTVTETIVEVANGSEVVTASQLNLTTETIVEPLYVSELVSTPLLTLNSEIIVESATGTELVFTEEGNVATIVEIAEFSPGDESVSVTQLVKTTETIVETYSGLERVYVDQLSVTPCTGPMALADLVFQRARIMDSITGQFLKILATTYYGMTTTNQQINGELDALFNAESLAQLHVMKTPCDVTAFLLGTEYISNVLLDTPVVQWRLNEALASPYCYDFSGRNMTLNVNGGVTLGQAGPLSMSSDTAALLDGSTGYLVAPLAVNTANLAALTVEAWVKITSATGGRILANSLTGTDRLGFQFYINASGNGATFEVGNGTTSAAASFATTLTPGTWYHLLGVYNGTTVRLYLNGVQTGSTPAFTSLIATANNPINIGRNPTVPNGYLSATIGQVALYRSALSAARALAHYNAGHNPT